MIYDSLNRNRLYFSNFLAITEILESSKVLNKI